MSVDKATRCKFSLFLICKSGFASKITDRLSKEKLAGQEVNFIHIDNASKNKSLEKSLNSLNNNLNIKIEHTTRKIP